jgi:hypothetical protein
MPEFRLPARIEMDAEIGITADSLEAAKHLAGKMTADAFDILEERIDILDPPSDPDEP